MQRALKKHWPLILSVTLLWAAVITLVVLVGMRTEWRQFYALDDPYIHMALSRTLAQHGVWGITSQGFTSSSSSILWTLLLAAVFRLGGDYTITPLLMNFLIATVLIIVAYFLLLKYQCNRVWSGVFLIAAIVLTPIPSIIFGGMEHSLQILIDLLFIFVAARILSETPSATEKKEVKLLLCLAPLVPMIRYEGLFLIAAVGFLLILRRRFGLAVLTGVLAVIPIGLYGAFSVKQGWSWLPNSILLKGSTPNIVSISGIISFSGNAIALLVGAPALLALLLGALSLYCYRRYHGKKAWEFGQVLLTVWTITLVLHVHFASTGWFYRYEAYLIFTGLLILGFLTAGLEEGSRLKWQIKIAALLILAPLCLRGVHALSKTPQACANIFEQQYQMAMFLKKNYSGVVVGANDIGAITYFANIDSLDFWGLANLEVAKAKRRGEYNTKLIDSISRAKSCRIAIVYDSWFRPYGGIPHSWVKIAQWDISNNVVCGDNKVSFYAVDPSEADHLEENLKAFSNQLPKNVVEHFRTTKQLAVSSGR